MQSLWVGVSRTLEISFFSLAAASCHPGRCQVGEDSYLVKLRLCDQTILVGSNPRSGTL